VKTEILRIAARHLKPFLLVLSLLVFYRGHNEPGGGFIGGLLAGMAFILYAGAFGVDKAKELKLAKPLFFIGLGIGLALLSALPGFFSNGVFMSAVWLSWSLGSLQIKLGTPLLFDLGVYFTVAGMLVKVLFSMMEEDS
jgi:multisubunit Na+/H+ antiporter MnhB subunit